MFKPLLFPVIALGCALAASPAAAEEVTTWVEYADLNLTTAEGRAALDKRLEMAARRLCNGNADFRNVRAMQSYRLCVAEARASYSEQVRVAVAKANGRRVAVLSSGINNPA